MKKSKNRQRHYARFRSPTPDEEGWESFVKNSNKNLSNNTKLKKTLDEKFKKVLSIIRTKSLNGIDFIVGNELRYFLGEFNNRVWKYGFGSLPSNFNVIEGFFKWCPDLFYFDLFEEEEYMLSMYDFFDFVTSKECSNSLDNFSSYTVDNLIYSYNILNSPKDILFSTTDSKKYVLGGVTFVKRDNEVFIMLIAGELSDTKKITKNIPNHSEINAGKSYIQPDENLSKEAVRLFNFDDLWKVNIYARIDLETKTIDSRYVQKDIGNSFETITDDVGMLLYSASKTTPENELNSFIQNQLNQIETYSPIFETAYNCLFLPEYFNLYDDEIMLEEHPTQLYGKRLSKSSYYHKELFYKKKDVFVLDRKTNDLSDNSSFKTNELKIEKSGYWKPLTPGEKGSDKNGNVIHNRTWVEKTLSWVQTNIEHSTVNIEIPKNSLNKGYIYLMRNAAHDIDIVKIGLTTKTPEERAIQLSRTSSPDKFLIIDKWYVKDCIIAEKLIHESLKQFRINPKREFFKIQISDAIKRIDKIIETLVIKS